MKTLRIDGRLAKVFVLKETQDSLVYIPVKSLFRIDYERLLKMEEQGGELLKTMAKTMLDNGRNALVQYDNVIQVLRYTEGQTDTGVRVRRPDELILSATKAEKLVHTAPKEPVQEVRQEQEVVEEKPARKRPGPKPGSKRSRNA